jgi:hypothetical protein
MRTPPSLQPKATKLPPETPEDDAVVTACPLLKCAIITSIAPVQYLPEE